MARRGAARASSMLISATHLLENLLTMLTAAVEQASAQTGSPSLLSAGAPDTYAIVEVGGHQMFVEPGKWYTCNRLQVRMGLEAARTTVASTAWLWSMCRHHEQLQEQEQQRAQWPTWRT